MDRVFCAALFLAVIDVADPFAVEFAVRDGVFRHLFLLVFSQTLP